MRKHSLNHITSHQNLKNLLHADINKKIHFFPQNKSNKRENLTKAKKNEFRKDGMCGSWLYESNKQNKNRINGNEFGSKKGIKTTKKNSSSYIGCNTSVEQSDNKHFETFNFKNMKVSHKEILKIPVTITDSDVCTKESNLTLDNFEAIYQKFKSLLNRYRQELIGKQKKIKELKKQNKFVRDKYSKCLQRKV